MQNIDPIIRPEMAEDALEIKLITAKIFGPGMRARAAYYLREGVPHEMRLSFVAELGGEIIGSVRLTCFMWGDNTALMLGPLGVLPQYKGQGVGRSLMFKAINEAKSNVADGGPPIVMLVGDLDYYKPFGFSRIEADKILLPRPADPQRVLKCELVDGVANQFQGAATRL